MASPRQRELIAQGLRTRVFETGPEGADEAIVFLHGAPGNAEVWAPLQAAAGGFARTVAFDLPGYGEADRPADADYSPRFYAGFIGAAIAALGIRRAHLVMNDIGSMGLAWAAEHPQAFASVVQIDTGLINSMPRWHYVGILFRLPVIGALGEWFGRLLFGPILRISDVLDRHVVCRWSREFDHGQRRALRRMYRSTPTSAGRHLIPVLSRLGRPSLIVWGRHDRFTPLAQAQVQRQAFPGSRLVVMERSGHYPHVDDPQGVVAQVLPFLAEQFAVPAAG